MESEMAVCPFNPRHTMMTDRLQRHVIRCMKNYPNWLSCPYHALHKFPNGDTLTKHMTECPFRETVQDLREKEYDARKNKTRWEVPVHIEGVKQINLSEENWDEEYQ